MGRKRPAAPLRITTGDLELRCVWCVCVCGFTLDWYAGQEEHLMVCVYLGCRMFSPSLTKVLAVTKTHTISH